VILIKQIDKEKTIIMFGHMEKTTILKQINVRENQRGNQE
jgi:hypothetical protein